MSQNKQKNKKDKRKKIRLQKQARLYALWKSIPAALREFASEERKIKLKKMGYDVSDDEFMKLLSVRTRTDFSREFGVSRRQLLRWDEDERVKEWEEEFNRQSNVLRFKKDIDFHFTRKTIKEGDAARVKLWYQLYQGWVEEKKVGLSQELQEALEKLNKLIDE